MPDEIVLGGDALAARFARTIIKVDELPTDTPLPTWDDLVMFVVTGQCPAETMEDATRRVRELGNCLTDPRITSGLDPQIADVALATQFFTNLSEPEKGEAPLGIMVLYATVFQAKAWDALEEGVRNTLPGYGLNPIIRAWFNRTQYVEPEKAIVLTAGKAKLIRIPNYMTTVALAEWEEVPEPELQMVTVDGVPVASATADKPEFRKQRRPKRVEGQQRPLFDLPGNKDADGLVLLLTRALERDILQELGEIDRRHPIHADVFYTLSLACAMTKPLTVDLDTYGAWLTGRYTTKGIKGAEREQLRHRAFRALDWARGWVMTKKGHPLALLDVNTVGLQQGQVELRPWGWGLALGTTTVGWRLTGAVANAAIRAAAATDGRSGNPAHSRASGYGTFGRIVAAVEDYIGASGPVSRSDSRDRLLVPDNKGGPGPVDFISSYEVMARAGLVWDPTDQKQRDKMRQLWSSLVERFDHGGYMLGKVPLAEAPAGDTIEILEVVKGNGKKRGGIHFRASARFVEAYAKTTAGKKGDNGLDHTPLPQLLEGRR